MIKPISLCSQCFKHEITSWLTEKSYLLKPEIISKLYLELKNIKLKDGECIVCLNNKISEDCFFKLLKILQKAPEELKQEYLSMFGYAS